MNLTAEHVMENEAAHADAAFNLSKGDATPADLPGTGHAVSKNIASMEAMDKSSGEGGPGSIVSGVMVDFLQHQFSDAFEAAREAFEVRSHGLLGSPFRRASLR